MFKNYFKIALRNLLKQKAYSFISIAGLAVGMACCILILLFVRHELSFDNYHPNADRIYRVVGESSNPYETFQRAYTPNPLGPALKSEFPEVLEAVRLSKLSSALIEANGKRFYENRFYLADSAVFGLFAFDFVQGESQRALATPNSLVLTESMAKKYFGEVDPLQQTIRFDNRLDFLVTGVIRDHPKNSHFHVDFIASTAHTGEVWRMPDWATRWGRSGFYTYVLLSEKSTPEDLQRKFPAFVEQNLRHSLDDDEMYTLSMQPLTSIHLYSHLSGELEPNSEVQYVYIFSAVALLILLVACGNYVNFATALGSKRATETGLRKVAGASKGQLVWQYLLESVLLSCSALVFALLLIEIALPAFNRLTTLNLQLTPLSQPLEVAALFAFAILVGCFSGAYPAFFLSSLEPMRAIKGFLVFHSRFGARLRKVLVVFQFAASIVLLIAFSIVQGQLRFIKDKKLGYEKERVVVIPLKGQEALQNAGVLKTELLQNSQIIKAALSSEVPNRVRRHSTAEWQGAVDRNLEIYHLMIDQDFLDLYEIVLLEGRNFSEQSSDGTGAYILNEAAVQAIGWQSALGNKCTIWGQEGDVIGVARNFHFASLHQKIEPLALHIRSERNRYLSVKIATENISQTLTLLEEKWQSVVPNRPFDFYFLDESFDEMYRAEAQMETLFGYFAVLAVFIACLGLLGLAAFMVEQRTKEIGIRKVLGATVANVTSLLSKDFVKLVLVANLIAWPAAWYVINEWLQNFAYHTDISLWIFALSGAFALAIALLTVSSQAIRAALANPVEALRYE